MSGSSGVSPLPVISLRWFLIFGPLRVFFVLFDWHEPCPSFSLFFGVRSFRIRSRIRPFLCLPPLIFFFFSHFTGSGFSFRTPFLFTRTSCCSLFAVLFPFFTCPFVFFEIKEGLVTNFPPVLIPALYFSKSPPDRTFLLLTLVSFFFF